VLQKNGFRLEGVQKDAVMCEGVPVDHLVYGLLRKDFQDIELNNQTKMEF
jgi:RimJ/RimL family protein N-acetyltransferase